MRTFEFMCEGAVKGSRMFRNADYTVTRHLADEDGIIMLSISRHSDRTHKVSWRDKQAIKNMLVGPEHEAIELFPAESRLMDTANEFWLWVLENKSRRFPVGFHTGRMVSDTEAWGSAQNPGSGATAEDEAAIAEAVRTVPAPPWAKAGEVNMKSAEWRLRRIMGWAEHFER